MISLTKLAAALALLGVAAPATPPLPTHDEWRRREVAQDVVSTRRFSRLGSGREFWTGPELELVCERASAEVTVLVRRRPGDETPGPHQVQVRMTAGEATETRQVREWMHPHGGEFMWAERLDLGHPLVRAVLDGAPLEIIARGRRLAPPPLPAALRHAFAGECKGDEN